MYLPNIIDDLPNEHYHHGEIYKDFCSSSVIKKMMISPKFAMYSRSNPLMLQTEAISQGSVYHSMCASLTNYGDMSGFENEYFIFDPPKNQRTGESYGYSTKAYQEALELATLEASGKLPCSQDEKHVAESMIDELLHGDPWQSPQVAYLMKIGKAEQSHFLEYQGQLFKYRTDLKTAKKIVDFKKVGDQVKTKRGTVKPDLFAKEIVKYGYDISAAFYQFFEHEMTGRWKKFYWIAQESDPPYDFLIHSAQNFAFDASDEIIEVGPGAMMFTRLLEQWTLCMESGNWPGYSNFISPDWKGYRIADPEVPGYYEKNVINFYND